MGNDMFNDEQLAHAEIVQKETEDALGFWKDRALKAEAALSALSRARETEGGAVREAAEIVCERLDGTGGAYYREIAPGLMDDIDALRKALSSPPRPATKNDAADPATVKGSLTVRQNGRPLPQEAIDSARELDGVEIADRHGNCAHVSITGNVCDVCEAVMPESFDDGYLDPPVNCGTFANITPAVADAMNAHSLAEMRPPADAATEAVERRLEEATEILREIVRSREAHLTERGMLVVSPADHNTGLHAALLFLSTPAPAPSAKETS